MEVSKKLFILQNRNKYPLISEVVQLEDGNYLSKRITGQWEKITADQYSEMSDKLKEYLNE